MTTKNAEQAITAIRCSGVVADLAILTKIDLAAAVGFDRDEVLRNIQSVRRGLEVLEVSAKTGEGLESWLSLLEGQVPNPR